MGFRDITIRNSYTGKGERILEDFLLPVMNIATNYDRITGFYSIESLLAISQGIESIYKRNGKMRLLVRIHSVPEDIIDAALYADRYREQIEKIRKEIIEDIFSLTDAFQKRRLATLAWMIEDGLLEIRAAAIDGPGKFHPKTLIFNDENGDSIAAIGSPNETPYGLGGNFEQVVVIKSWENDGAVQDQSAFFDDLWNDRFDGASVFEISKETADMIRDSLGKSYCKPEKQSLLSGCIKSNNIIAEAAQMPANFFVSGDIPALYMHQERAVISGLSRWPVRVLYADEVGLGKTFEAASTIVFLTKYCNVKRVVILTPKSVLQQWQDELEEHFGLSVWLYDSVVKEYISSDKKKRISIRGSNPIGPKAPNMILMSAQYARGTGNSLSIFERSDSILPDLLVVDEAHSARISTDISGKKKKTRMYSMLEKVADKIPHLVFATATPMQKEASEYHALLKLLGLPAPWNNERLYLLSLKLINSSKAPDISDATSAAKLLHSTIVKMSPDLSEFTHEEQDSITELESLIRTADNYDIASFIIDNWILFRELLIKLHPAHLLTVRNTRRSLEEVGYKFPKRNLIEKEVNSPLEVQLFYIKVEEYLSNICFSIEQALEPEKNINVGFVRISYQQRVASSLYSCLQSLERRYAKAVELRNILAKNGFISKSQTGGFNGQQEIDDIEEDDIFISGVDVENIFNNETEIDIDALKRAVSLECTNLNSLISRARKLIDTVGDMKIKTAISLAMDSVGRKEPVLLFSRYTDTIEALLYEYNNTESIKGADYAIYTGQKSVIVHKGIETKCSKDDIKKALASGRIFMVFCSDAASEGLNLQAARVLINVDVPWTPARLEQRIGRIARLGQKAEEVDVYNIWYPYSIEARMYHRIQKRLDQINIAIGEFPEIVANGIKNLILENREQDDTSYKELLEIRNSNQKAALEKLWANKELKTTTSSLIRDQLMDICNTCFKKVNAIEKSGINYFMMPDGTIEELTNEPGQTESISLQSAPFHFTDYKIPELFIKKDNEGRSAAFIYGSYDSSILKHESVLRLISDKFSDDMKLKYRPVMLVNMDSLHLDYSIKCNLKKTPDFWFDKDTKDEC